MESGKKVSLCRFFVSPEDREFVEKMRFGAILQQEQQFIACCQTHSDYGPPKMSLKLEV